MRLGRCAHPPCEGRDAAPVAAPRRTHVRPAWGGPPRGGLLERGIVAGEGAGRRRTDVRDRVLI
eukprot:2973295-Pyramimonas_sp.AAC.1